MSDYRPTAALHGPGDLYPAFVGLDFAANRAFSSARHVGQKLLVHPTIEQDLRPVHPSYIDFGPQHYSFEFPSGVTHVSLALAEAGWRSKRDQPLIDRQNAEVNRIHRDFGWEDPANSEVLERIGRQQLIFAREHFDWGVYSDRPLLISMELIRSDLPIPESSRYPYDETLHTDSTDPLWPVLQGFWANVRHTLISTSPTYIGEGSESIRHSHGELGEPTNVTFGEAGYVVEQLPDRHLILADSKRLPHARPNLALPLEPGEDTVRYYLRTYIEPLRRSDDKFFVGARNLGEIAAHYGLQWQV
jgi:hypothetical protein